MKKIMFGIMSILIMLALHTVGANSVTDNMILPGAGYVTIPENIVSDKLYAGDILEAGTSIKSQNGKYVFKLQNDGNLVLYDSTNKNLWVSNTAKTVRAVMQNDGNFVIKDAGNIAKWATNSNGNPGAYLIVQNDGNVVIYNKAGTAVWSTNTGGTPSTPPNTKPPNEVPIPPILISINANRIIDKATLPAGSETGITVKIQNDNVVRSFSLKEMIPKGWSLTVVSDDANSFKISTNEWAWYSVAGKATKTANYKLKVPSGTSPGKYNIDGSITTSQTSINVKGDNFITVIQEDILQYYRGMGSCADIVETNDLLIAADDWTHNIIPSGFSASITTSQLLTLADEWISSGTSCNDYIYK